MDLRPQQDLQQEQEHAVPRHEAHRKDDAHLQRKRNLPGRALHLRPVPVRQLRPLTALLLAFPLLTLAGCRAGTLPDPNDPRDGLITPEALQKNLKSVNESLYARWVKREFDEQEYRRLIAQAADELVADVPLDALEASNAWRYAEVLIAAKRWEEAAKVLEVATRHAKMTKNEDRRVNDTLRMARCLAELGRVPQAIETARSVFDAPRDQTAPVLMAVLYEIVPPARGKGEDEALAKLLEDAAVIHMTTKVDPRSESGGTFLSARSHHVSKALKAISSLYEDLGRPDEAAEAVARVRDRVSGPPTVRG